MSPLARLGAQDRMVRRADHPTQTSDSLRRLGHCCCLVGRSPLSLGARMGCWGGKVLLPIPETPSALPFRGSPVTSGSTQASHLSPHHQHSDQKMYVEDKRMTPLASHRTSSPALLTSATGSESLVTFVTLMATLRGPFPSAL